MSVFVYKGIVGRVTYLVDAALDGIKMALFAVLTLTG